MSKQQLKIAFLGNQIAWGGGAKSLLLLIKSISNLHFRLYLFVTHCVSQEMEEEFKQYVEFVKIINLPEITSAQTQSVKNNMELVYENNIDFSQVDCFADELNHLKIDILHINNSVFSLVYKTIRSKTKVKIVSHIREWIDWNGIHQKQKFIIDTLNKNSDAIICISETEAKVFNNNTNLYIIPNPFDFQELELFEKNFVNIKSSLGLDDDHFIVGMMGRYQENKGFLDFLRALAYLKKNYTNVSDIKFIILGGSLPSLTNKFIFALKKIMGKSTFSYNIHKFLKKENLFDEVFFLSNRKNILEIINTFDVAVRPSYSGDPWGRDIIEYMALRKPIVATGSSEFFIKEGGTGFLVPPRDYIQLAEKIYWLFRNKNERIQMGMAAHEQIYSKCNMNEFRSKILKVYKSL